MSETAAPPRRRFRVLKILALNLASLAIILGAIEAYFRATQSYIVTDVEGINAKRARAGIDRRLFVKYTLKGRRLVPNTVSRIMNHPTSGRDVEIRVNSLGFRGPEVPTVHPPDQLRVLALGDSIALAAYLPEEQGWVARLERLLKTSRGGRDALVVNAGVVDVGIAEEVAILDENGLKIDPDVVLVAFYLNDLRPPHGFPGEKRALGPLRRHSVFANYLYERFELMKFIKDKGIDRLDMKDDLKRDEWRTDRAEFMRLVEKSKMDWGSAWEDEPYKILDREFARLKRLSLEHDFKVVVAVFPVRFQVYADFLDDRPQQTVARKAAEHGFYFVDLLGPFREHRDQDLFYEHCHLTPTGNDLAASAIARFMVEQGL